MDEDAGVRAPVTRLRRRLSVEQTEESKSPAVGTPTKKRGGRKAAKPDLELIDENTPDNTTTKRTNKTTATKDVTAPEEKSVTPARRSTRVKSNTSIISEAATVIDSPRAKRATRRASFSGSDTEAPLGIRQTRRTRKDSASSVEKEPQLPPKQGIQITEVIIEEPEANSIELTPHAKIATDQSLTNSTRKSPRLLEKKKTSPAKTTVKESSNDIPVSETTTTIPAQNSSITQDSISLPSQDSSDEPKNKTDTPDAQYSDTQTLQNRLSIGSAKLIEELNTDIKNKSNFNKSWSDNDGKESTTNRKRTKSWTTQSAYVENTFYCDNESTKNKIKNSTAPSMLLNKSRSGDGALNTSLNQSMSNKSTLKRKKKDSMNFVVEKINKHLDKINTIDNDIETKNESLSIAENNTKNLDVITSELLEKEPSGDIKAMIYIEDSDSNSEKINIKTRHENEDQCVPVIEHAGETSIKVNTFTSILDKNEQNMLSNSELPQRKDSEQMECEPMDIDETIPDNILIPEMESTDLNNSVRKSGVHIANLSCEEIVNKSGRKSSITQSFDKSEIDTKSTLILSQIKDASTGDINAAKSPQVIINKLLSTVDDLNITQENDMEKKISRHYSTSTPLQDKNIKNYKATQINPSIPAIQNNESINTSKEIPNTSKGQHKNISKIEHNHSSENENSKEPIHTGNAKNKDESKKSFNEKEMSMNQSEIGVRESKEKIETDENVNNGDVVTHKQKIKVEDVSLNKKSNKPLTKIKGSQKNKSSSEESGEEIESDDDAAEKKLFIDEEAVDAGDDYESGDSQNESERRYARENEVIDKGETLTTDGEFSDDSDYEKDSFIVSSNEEDNELLDGLDDDFSMSDEELIISAKSKKKYNDRKVKEQKQASREMFESRHKLNSSNKSTNSAIGKTKKNKRQQISSSESEEDIKPRKNNRLRLDSTKEASLLADKSEHKISIKKNKQQPDMDNSSDESVQNKKEMIICNEIMKKLDSTKEASLLSDKSEQKISIKKNKLLPDSASSSDESVPNEKEMTICNETIKESDPLSAQIKTEPKTPQRSANSTIAFIDSEEVEIGNNESTKTQSEFLDPLQATITADDDDDSLSSDTDIMQNYDSILKDLNKNSKIKPKVADISLNLDTKSKKKEKTAIVDELNLTQVKSDKKPKDKQNKEPDTSVNEKVSKRDDDEASSDSIDLHLLFSEDSNNSDTSSLQNKMKAAKTNADDIIPLKRTEAKTDIRESKVKNKYMEVSFNQSINKKNKIRESHQKENILSDEEQCTSFFIDTVGSHAQDDKNQSTENFDFTKDKSVKKLVSKTPVKGSSEESCEDDAPLEISYKKEENSKRKSKAQDNIDIVIDQPDNEREKSINKSIAKTPGSEKRKKKTKVDEEISKRAYYEPDKSINKSIAKTPSSEKKNKKKTMEEEISEHADYEPDKSINKSIAKTPSSEKKNKKKTMEEEISEHADYEPDKSINKSIAKTPSSEKKNKKKTTEEEISEHADYEPGRSINKLIVKSPSSEKKNKKKTMEEEISEHADYEPDKSINKSIAKTPSSEKKNKKKTTEEEISEHADYEPGRSINKSIVKTPSSEKKNKKKTMEEEISEHADYEPDKSINKSISKTCGSEKKNKKKAMDEEISEHADLMSETTSNKSLLKTNSGKKKKRHTEPHSEEQNVIQEVPIESKTSEKKKRKETVCNSLDKIPSIPDTQDLPNESENSEKKKRKHYATDENISVEITKNIEPSSKKRKRKSSPNTTNEDILPADVDTAKPLNEPIGARKKKKRKIVTQDDIVSETVPLAEKHVESRNDKKSASNVPNSSSNIGDIINNKKKNKKRKEREDYDTSSSKTLKVNIFDKVPRLPPYLLEKLDDVPHREVPSKKPKLISTTEFLVEETMKRKNKPSDYLEESVYLNESTEKRRNKKKRLEKPKVLPFVPTASTSNNGFTTNFKINVLPRDITFVAQSNTIDNFKDNYVLGKKIKRLGTYDMYKKLRNIKLSKF